MTMAQGVAAAARPWRERQPAPLAIATLRGVAQVDLQSGLLTGLLITVALFSAGWEPGAAGLAGAAASTLTATGLGVDRARIRSGLEGYCGALIAIASVTFLEAQLSSWVVAIAGACAGTVVLAATAAALDPWRLPPLTAPFCLVASLIVIGAPQLHRIWPGGSDAALPGVPADTGPIAFDQLAESLLTNVSQVFLVDAWWAGLIMLVALAFAGPRVLAAACAGSLAGTLTAWAAGAPADLVADGLYGYNAVLVTIALAARFLAPTGVNLAYALAAAACSTVLAAGMTDLFAPVGGHALTWPFVLTTWTFLAAAPLLPAVTTPPREEGAG
jgi:urea transporter